jgi:hypothetical protein
VGIDLEELHLSGTLKWISPGAKMLTFTVGAGQKSIARCDPVIVSPR